MLQMIIYTGAREGFDLKVRFKIIDLDSPDNSPGMPIPLDFDKMEALPHIVRHSPDGFEWGYQGSGPADLSLSLLTHFFSIFFKEEIKNTKMARSLASVIDLCYQTFKQDIVSHFPKEEWIYDSLSLMDWVQYRHPWSRN